MLSQIGLIGLIQPELSRGKAKKLIYLKFGYNVLNMISK